MNKVFLYFFSFALLIPKVLATNYCVCGYMKTEPVMDGNLQSDPAWKNISTLVERFTAMGTEAQASKQTNIKTGFTDQFIYIGIECKEPDMNKIKAILPDKGDLWSEDSMEIFILPEGAGNYFQFIVNSIGSRWSSKSYEWEAKVYRGKDFWSAEIKIPFKELGKTPQNNETWKINFGRNICSTGTHECSSWRQVTASFHEIENFGTLIFKRDSEKINFKEVENQKASAEIKSILDDSIFYTLQQDTELRKKLSEILTDKKANILETKEEVNKIRDSLLVRQFLIKELVKDLKQARLVSDSLISEFTVIANNSKDKNIRGKAFSIVKEGGMLEKRMKNMNALTYEETLSLFARSKTMFRDADELRYEILVKQMFNDEL